MLRRKASNTRICIIAAIVADLPTFIIARQEANKAYLSNMHILLDKRQSATDIETDGSWKQESNALKRALILQVVNHCSFPAEHAETILLSCYLGQLLLPAAVYNTPVNMTCRCWKWLSFKLPNSRNASRLLMPNSITYMQMYVCLVGVVACSFLADLFPCQYFDPHFLNLADVIASIE